MAFPRPALEANAQLVSEVAALVVDEGATIVIVGLARSLSGAEGPAAAKARAMVEDLGAALAGEEVSIELHDERLTTVEAARSLAAAGHSTRTARPVVDSAAAAVLLESWLAGR
jgi:putative Holliday junction resolvase